MKLGLLAASLVLVAGGAVGCGDDSSGGSSKADGGSADKGASTEDFCGAFQAFADDLQDVTGQEENLGEILKKAAQRIEDVGTPDGIPDDAKEGLELTLEAIQGLPDNASAQDLSTLEDDFSEADQKKVDAFSDYLDKTCPDLGDSGSSDDPSGEASDDSGDGS